jgi:hypothetical protein
MISESKDIFLGILFGCIFKITDEIMDVPIFKEQFSEYIEPLKVSTIFLYGLQAANDFYYNLVFLFFSAFSFIGGSIDDTYWYVCWFLTLFATVWTFSYPLPETHLLLLIGLLFVAITTPALDNIISPEENSYTKMILTYIYTIIISTSYFFFLQSVVLENPTLDVRYISKYFGAFIGYFLTRSIVKTYLYYTSTEKRELENIQKDK